MKDHKWWIIEKHEYGQWKNIQGTYAYRADTSVLHTFIGAVAVYLAAYYHHMAPAYMRFVNKKTGKIIQAENLLCVRMVKK